MSEHADGSVKELGHIVLYVSNLARSVDFYHRILGWHMLTPADAGLPVALFSGGRTHHELLLIEVGPGAQPIPAGRRVGMYHFGLKVGDSDDELRAVLARLRASGIKILGATDHIVTHSVYIADPDGNEVELYIDVPDVDWRTNPELIMAPGRRLAL